MSSPFLAEIRIFPYNFAPTGWALCNGQLLPISQNTALFSLLGTTYGGDGRSTFALPDLQDRFPMNHGQGQGLTDRFLGEAAGTTAVTLLTTEIPVHNHLLMEAHDGSSTQSPSFALPGPSPARPYAAGPANVPLAPVQPAGSGFAHNNMPPYLGFTFCIAMQGIFPPRN
jgi:microcystin-dependent protein